MEPTREVLVPGLLTIDDYDKRRATWDEVRQCIGLDACFYEGAELLLFPPVWLDRAERLWREQRGSSGHRQAKGIGVDPGEGGANSAMASVDELGVIELQSPKTPDTTDVTSFSLAFMQRHGVPPERTCLDRGGGGKQHADRLRSQGFPVRTVAFGESILLPFKRGIRRIEERNENREERYSYFNRRAEMYGEFSLLLDPSLNPRGFMVPDRTTHVCHKHGSGCLRAQLAAIKKVYDKEGRLKLPPKNRDPGQQEGSHKTLVELIGHSPDEADAIVLAVFAMQNVQRRAMAGAAQ